jgi:hypothetical protein
LKSWMVLTYSQMGAVPKGDRFVQNRLCPETLVLLLQVADRETEMYLIQLSSPSHLWMFTE